MKIISITDIFKKPVFLDKKLNVYQNGEDNAYPERIDRYINNSVTAKTATNLMIQSLIQKGLGIHSNVIVNKNKQLTFSAFADDIANSKVRQRGSFVWIGWNANYKIGEVQLLPFHNCRISKQDTEEYSAKILYSKMWEQPKQTDLIEFDVYNSNQNVIESQVVKAKGWEKYKGQVLCINDDNDYIYPLSRIDAVQMDCDSESQASIYKNVTFRKGFFGKTAVITRPLTDNDLPKTIYVDGREIGNPEYYQQISDRDAFKKTIEDFVGAENAGGALHIELDYEHEDLEKAILFKNIESNLSPDLFQGIEQSIRNNILIAFNNLPNGLVSQSEGIFSNSGEAITEMKKQFDENCAKERGQLLELLNVIWKQMEAYDGKPIAIKMNNETETELTNLDTKTQDAQAQLRGSVGGVTSLLLIQQSVGAGTTSFEAGIAMLQNIYGYSEDVARKMLGNPAKTEPITTIPNA